MRLEPAISAAALAAIRAPFLESTSETLDAPILQPLGLLLDLAGETLRERLFVVQGDGPEACLRPDFTLPALQAHIDSGRPTGRYFYSGHAFRVAPRGVERAEEFLQIGVEAFHDGDRATADADMAILAWRASVAGGRADLSLMVGDVGLFGTFVEALGVAAPLASRLRRAFSNPRRLRAELEAASADRAAAEPAGGRLAELLASLSPDAASGVLEEIWALAGIEPVGGRSAAEIVHRLAERAALAAAPRLTPAQAELIGRFLTISGQPDEVLEAIAALAGPGAKDLATAHQGWRRRLAALAAAGVPADRITFSAAFGRAFGYYDGMVFEVRSAALGEDRPVAAGGRYDGLPARLGSAKTSAAVGCMVRPGRAWAGGAG